MRCGGSTFVSKRDTNGTPIVSERDNLENDGLGQFGGLSIRFGCVPLSYALAANTLER